jgi:uncharacterized protein YvpB
MDFQELRQLYTFDCGVSFSQSVLTYYGYNKREDELLKKLKAVNTNVFDNGVTAKSIMGLFIEHKLKPKLIRGMKAEELPAYIDEGVPVIVLLQAYKEKDNKKEYKDDYVDGHYVVAVGYDNGSIIFEDPSAYNRTCLTYEELDDRWHANNDNNKPDPVSLAIAVYGVRKFRSNQIEHME